MLHHVFCWAAPFIQLNVHGCVKQLRDWERAWRKARPKLFVFVRRAVNQQKDIVFDGTMTWAPFVKQTLAMVRDHRHNYRRGPGYTADDAGHTVELCATLHKHASVAASGLF